jgi:hypothetical protein
VEEMEDYERVHNKARKERGQNQTIAEEEDE